MQINDSDQTDRETRGGRKAMARLAIGSDGGKWDMTYTTGQRRRNSREEKKKRGTSKPETLARPGLRRANPWR